MEKKSNLKWVEGLNDNKGEGSNSQNTFHFLFYLVKMHQLGFLIAQKNFPLNNTASEPWLHRYSTGVFCMQNASVRISIYISSVL